MNNDWKNTSGKKFRSINDFPEGCVGFIYRIDNLSNGKFYIGEKALYSVTNPAISKKKYDELKAAGESVRKTKHKGKSKKGNVVWIYKRRDVVKETNWKTYTGSNDQLNEDIAKGDVYSRTILYFCTSKKEKTFREIEQIIKHDCLDDCMCYNSNILGKFFKQTSC